MSGRGGRGRREGNVRGGHHPERAEARLKDALHANGRGGAARPLMSQEQDELLSRGPGFALKSPNSKGLLQSPNIIARDELPHKVHPFQISQSSMPKMNPGMYIGRKEVGYGGYNPADFNYMASANTVFQEFRKLECRCCSNVFGYQHRFNPELLMCSPRCLSRITSQSEQVPVAPPGYPRENAQAQRQRTAPASMPPHATSAPNPPEPSSQVTRILRTEVLDSKPKGRGNQSQGKESDLKGITENKKGRGAVVTPNFGNRFIEKEGFDCESTKQTQMNSKSTRNPGRGRGASRRGGRGGFRGSFHGHGESLSGLYEAEGKSEPRTVVDSATAASEIPPVPNSGPDNCKRPAAKPLSILSRPAGAKKLTIPLVPNAGAYVADNTVVSGENVPVKLRRGWKFSDLKLSKNLNKDAEIFLAYVDDSKVNKLILQAVKDEEKVQNLRKSLNAYCRKARPLSKDRLPFEEDIVFARTCDDDDYYRGKVVSVDMKDGKMTVDFFEEGGVYPVHLSDCREPCDKIMQDHPIYGIKFTVTPFDFSLNHKKLTIATEKAQENNNFFIHQLTRKNQWSWTGEIISSKSNKTWNEIMRRRPSSDPTTSEIKIEKAEEVEAPPIEATPAPPIPASEEIETPTLADVVDSASPPEELKVKLEVKKEKVCVDESDSAEFHSLDESEEKVEVKADTGGVVGSESREPEMTFAKTMKRSKNILDNGTKVRVRFVWSNRRLTVSVVDDDKDMEGLEDAIIRYVPDAPNMNREPEVDEVVLAPYEGQYYRGKVLSLAEDQVHVEFIDYGADALVDKALLKELNSEIAQHPVYGWTVLISGIPEDAPNVESEELNLIDTEVEAQIELEKEDNGIWTGQLWVARDRTWTEIVLDALAAAGFGDMLPKRTVNPWSAEILELLGLEADSIGGNPIGRYKTLLDQKLSELFGENYMVTLSSRCFRKYLKSIKDFQHGSILQQNPREEPLWSDTLGCFYYDMNVIPRIKIPLDAKIHVRLTVFRDVHDWEGIPLDEPVFTYQQRLRQMLKEYCTDQNLTTSNFTPRKYQLCLVCVPSWAVIDKYMAQEKGRGWDRKAKIHRRTNWKEEDGWQANNWFRGVMVGTCSSSVEESHCFEFWLVDVCRYVPVPRGKILPAVLRFATIPALGIFGCFLPYNDKTISPEERRQKWYSVLHKGTVFPCTVLGHARIESQETTLVRMPPDIEEKFSKMALQLKDESAEQRTIFTKALTPESKTLREKEVICATFD